MASLVDPSIDLFDRTDLTWEEFCALPQADEHRFAELVDGRLIVNPPTPLHQLIGIRLSLALQLWIRGGDNRGEAYYEAGVKIAERRGYVADVAWWPAERCPPPGEPPSFAQPPGLIVEVESRSTRRLDRQRKRQDYPTVGVDELWLIDPDEPSWVGYRRDPTAAAHEPYDIITETRDVDEPLTSPQLPGFSVTLAELTTR